MVHIRSDIEIEKISKSCQVVKETMEMIEKWVNPGITTLELDNKAEEFIRSKGAVPGFKGLYGYPATLCVSIDDEVVHGLPSNRKLIEGETAFELEDGIDLIDTDSIGNHTDDIPFS